MLHCSVLPVQCSGRAKPEGTQHSNGKGVTFYFARTSRVTGKMRWTFRIPGRLLHVAIHIFGLGQAWIFYSGFFFSPTAPSWSRLWNSQVLGHVPLRSRSILRISPKFVLSTPLPTFFLLVFLEEGRQLYRSSITLVCTGAH